jgi:hypothetical protein
MRNWTEIGAEFDRAIVERAIAVLDWQKLPIETGMMQGEGIKAAIRMLGIPRVSHVAVGTINNGKAEGGLCFFYGIRGHYENGDADVFIVDRGSDMIPVCSDFTSKEVTH